MRPQPSTHTTLEGFNKSADEAALRAYKHRRASDWSVLGITVLMVVIVTALTLATM